MTRVEPLHCTYCDEVSQWSSERTETTLLGEEHSCPSCGMETTVWDEDEVQELERDVLPQFESPAPLF